MIFALFADEASLYGATFVQHMGMHEEGGKRYPCGHTDQHTVEIDVAQAMRKGMTQRRHEIGMKEAFRDVYEGVSPAARSEAKTANPER